MSKSSPPKWESPFVAKTSNISSSSIVNKVTSNVPPPKSKTIIIFSSLFSSSSSSFSVRLLFKGAGTLSLYEGTVNNLKFSLLENFLSRP